MTNQPSSGAGETGADDAGHSGQAVDSEPIDAEFKPADPVSDTPTSAGSGPGWTGAMALAVLAAIGGSVGGTFGGRLLGPSAPVEGVNAGAGSESLNAAISSLETAQATETAALSARLDGLETRTGEVAEAVASVRETLASFENDIERVDRISTFDRRLSALETAQDGAGDGDGPSDVALSALTARVDALEEVADRLERATDAIAGATDGVDFTALSDQIAALNAEVEAVRADTRAVADLAAAAPESALSADLALALADITRAAAAGEGFAGPHADLAAALPGDSHVVALAPLAADGVATPDQLTQRFEALAADAVAADPAEPEGGLGLAERLFGDQIKVRREGEISVADQVDAARTALSAGDLRAAIDATSPLPGPVLDVLAPWRNDAEDRLALEAALDGLRRTLADPSAALEANP